MSVCRGIYSVVGRERATKKENPVRRFGTVAQWRLYDLSGVRAPSFLSGFRRSQVRFLR